jgi:predicted PurR-regulated permease PerM
MRKNEYTKYIALALIFVVGAGLIYMLWVYFTAIVSALIFSYLFSPVYLKAQGVVKSKGLAAFLTILLIFLIALIPALIVLGITIKEAAHFANTVRVEEYAAFIHKVVPVQVDIHQLLLRLAGDFVGGLQSSVPSMVSIASHFFISLFIMFFIMYYIFINLHMFIARTVDLLPFSQENAIRFIREFENMSKAIILGQLLVALAQGFCGGIGFFLFGIDGAVFWGFVMAVLSFIPVLGAFLIWLPAGIVQMIYQNYFAGVGILLWGAIVVSNIDNILRPRLVEKRTNINPVITLLGVFIGLEFFGIIGIVVGPLILSLFFVLVQMFRQEYLDGKSLPSEEP